MTGARQAPGSGGAPGAHRSDGELIAWRGAARRVGHLAGGCVAAGVAVYAVAAFAAGQLSGRPVALGLGVATGALLAGAVTMVARAAVRGMLAAGRRGERLAGHDVGLTPPQARDRVRGRRTTGTDGADGQTSGGPP